ncbi:MAG: hypothetical protein IKH77_04620 [Clostridia bacterium]|nr:hypothetical protein [Clostridia bacterium]
MKRSAGLRRIIAVLLTVMMVLLPSSLGAEDDFAERQPYHSDWWHPPVGEVTGEYSFSGTGDAVLLPYLLGLHGIYGIVISAVTDSDAVTLSDDLYLTAVASFDTVRLTVTTNFGTHVFLLHNPGETPAIPAGTEVTGDSGSFTASGEVPAGTGLFVGTFEPSEQQRAAVPAGSDTSVVWLEIGLRSPEGAEVHTGAEVSVNTRIELPAAPALNGLTGRTVVRDARLYHVVSGAEVEELPVEVETENGQITGLHFSTTSFSGFALVYTVDFVYDLNGQVFEFSLPGGGFIPLRQLMEALGIRSEDGQEMDRFLTGIDSVAFSDPSLVWVGQAGEAGTVGQVKAANGLHCEYSAELTEAQIAAINDTPVAAGEWLLISLKPFLSEETLTITMKGGDVMTVKVTDAQAIPDAEEGTLNPNKSYLICYQVGNTYYLLKNDGTVDSAYHPNFDGDPDPAHDFEHLNSTYAWSFGHIFKEQDVEHHLDKNYYLIRPIDNKARTLTLNFAGQPLVQQGNNNVAVIQSGSGFILEGYHNVGTEADPRYIHLGFAGGAFAGVDGEGVTVRIYEMASLPAYDYLVRSEDEVRGTVTVDGGTQQEIVEGGIVVAHYCDATSTADKKNAGTITATPVYHPDTGGRNKWLFDHWELDGQPLDRDQYPATIPANTLTIPYNGSNLVAYFSQNPAYEVPEHEKVPSSIADMTGWLNGLQNRNIPLDSSATQKTAEVYDYQNRIYRVDITSRANFETFAGNLDMAFCLDVSNSMYFPSALVEADTNRANPMPIYQINNSGWGWDNRGWLDRSRGWNNPYYLIADASGTATVFKIYYQDGNWKAQDASRTTESDKSFVIGTNFETNWTKGANTGNHPFGFNDTDNTVYTIYNAGDNNRNRFVYLNQALSGSSSDLNVISGLLAVAGDASPGVRIAYNTFNKELGNQRQDFIPASSGLTVNLHYASGGGTRPDQAFADAQNFSWTADYTLDGSGNLVSTDRYVILVTDGAPQGVRTGEPKGTTNADIEGWVRTAARNLKNNSHVKIITVGLSMENVTSGKRLLYDLADTDSKGNKMFYMAESGSDLHNIFRQITKVLMEDAVVMGDVSDTVGEGFYLVDKATGRPLAPRDMIDIDGNRTTDPSRAAGVVQDDGRTVLWSNQAIDAVAGWHGTVYVKAQEELLGGNGMNTNNDEATIVAKNYRVGGEDIPFDTTLVRDTLNLTAELPTPRVNVNELTFFSSETEWTVCLGEEVDPKQQLRALYDGLVVEQVVNEDASLHFTSSPNSIDERWGAATGTAATFSLPDLIERLIRQDPDKTARYFTGSELNWDAFLEDMMGDGITLPYHEFGLTDNSRIKLTLEKTVVEGEESDLVNESPHATTVTGNEVEKYVLRVAYEPDYTVTPIGQGGQSTEDFHTGTFGTMYQGHATGREASTNEHVINVYTVPLEAVKTDPDGTPLSGAAFRLYQEDDGGTAVEGLDSTRKYVEVATATSGADGLARLKDSSDSTKDFEMVLEETYYLIETTPPRYYAADTTVRTVTMQAENGRYTDLEGNALSGKTYPFNWNQGVKLLVTDESEGTTETIPDSGYVTHAQASITFRYNVVNTPLEAELPIPVKKTLRGRDMKANEFAFVLQPIDISGERGSALQVINNPAGKENKEVTFNFSLDYDTEGALSAPYRDTDGNAVFFYVVYEEKGSATDIIYSDLQYIVRVTLTQEGNALIATPQYFLYGGSGALPPEATAGLQAPETTAIAALPHITP